jgi:two-component system, OmpR family, sensor histidine kinase MprB
MTLRVRLAIALALLAAVSVVAVAAISYTATDQRLHDEVDASLVSSARQLGGPGGRSAAELCRELDEGRFPHEFGPLGQPGVIVQCLDAAGRITGSIGPPGVLVHSPGVDLTARTSARERRSDGRDGDHGPGPGGSTDLWTQRFGEQAYRVVAVAGPGGGEIRIGRGLAETGRVMRAVRNRSILVGLVIILLAAAAGVLVARRTTRPVTQLTDAAEEIAASGRLDIPVPPAGRDEIGRLTRAFASMLGALTRSRDQQQRLVQDAGHELRTPLTSLRANIDTLRRHPDLAAVPRDQLLADLDSELRELSGLMDELVALAVDRYDDEPAQTVALDQLAERAAERARRRSGRAIVVDAEPAPVVGKPQQLLRAVGNLLDNAVKFSPDAAPIELTVRPGRLEVRDHGRGIAADDLPLVFDRFHRALDARSLPGSGLGLAIVRQIVEASGGTVEAANDPGRGAVFTIRLPAAPADS